jgi:hypothetical protein
MGPILGLYKPEAKCIPVAWCRRFPVLALTRHFEDHGCISSSFLLTASAGLKITVHH